MTPPAQVQPARCVLPGSYCRSSLEYRWPGEKCPRSANGRQRHRLLVTPVGDSNQRHVSLQYRYSRGANGFLDSVIRIFHAICAKVGGSSSCTKWCCPYNKAANSEECVYRSKPPPAKSARTASPTRNEAELAPERREGPPPLGPNLLRSNNAIGILGVPAVVPQG